MRKTILAFVAIAMSCVAFNSCDKIDDLVISDDSKITIGTTDYKVSFACQGVSTNHLGLALISNGLTYDGTNKLGGNGVLLVIDTPAASESDTWATGTYTIASASGDMALQSGQVNVGYATVVSGAISTPYYLTSGTLKVTKTDSKYTLDLSGVNNAGTKVTSNYSGLILVASVPNLNQ